MNARTALLCLLCGLCLPQCIQTSAQCTQPEAGARTEQTGERQAAEGPRVDARKGKP